MSYIKVREYFDIIYTAGDSLSSTIRLTLEELEKHTLHSGWIDIGKGWYTNEDE